MTLRHPVRNALHQISCELSVVRKIAMYVHAVQDGESLNLDCRAGWNALAKSNTTILVVMGWLWLVGSIKLQVSFAKEPYKRNHILQKRPII